MKEVIKILLPRSVILYTKDIINRFNSYAIKIASTSKLLTNVYYFINTDFSGEHYAVMKGRVRYHESLLDISESCALLRRNIHRIEKGLIMRPRRNIFAEGFVQETVDCYCDSINSKKLAINEKKWATDVLEEYFNIVGSTSITNQAKKTYIEARKGLLNTSDFKVDFPSVNDKFKPYSYDKLPVSTINFEELKQLFIRRRSVRWYQKKKVPLELINKAVSIASFAPSACNRQPYRFFFCNDKKKAVAIAECAGGTAGFSENIPAIIAIVGDLSAYPNERDRHLIYIDGSLAAMQLMLALETLGLSTCSLNWPDIDENEHKIRNIIDLKDYERVVMLLAIGYADSTGGIPYSQKKDSNLILEDISK